MRTATVGRERRRIEAAFSAAIVAASAVAVVEACGSSGNGAAASVDASVASVDGGADGAVVEGEADVAGEASADAGTTADAPNCAPTYFVLDGATLATIDAAPDADLCEFVEPCGLPEGLATQGCLVIETQADGTPIPDSGFGCSATPLNGCVNGVYSPPSGPSVEFTCICELFIQGGRRTGRARRARAVMATTSLGAFFAAMAREERASVRAFERLATELAEHRAPTTLVRAAKTAALDEVRHAVMMGRLARAHGAAAEREREVRCVDPVRSVEAIARENAVEGCVRETFAALLARWQADHAKDATIRRAFARIAKDEARHAALAWAVAAWAGARLDAEGNGRVARAKRSAIDAVKRSLRNQVDPAVANRAGVASSQQARLLFAEMTRALVG